MDSETAAADLLNRIRRLEDINAIKRLRNWYHRHLNDCEFNKMADLFAVDGVCDIGYMLPQPMVGREAIAAGFGGMRARLGQAKQFIHSHTIEDLDADHGAGWAILEARYGNREGKAYNLAAHCDDTYERVDGKWYFKSLRVKFYYSVPHVSDDWAGPDRHQLVRQEGFVPPRDIEGPNPPL